MKKEKGKREGKNNCISLGKDTTGGAHGNEHEVTCESKTLF